MRTGKRARIAVQTGFTYLWSLMILVVLSVSLAVIGPVWSAQVRRERERSLIHIGMLYTLAIEAYYNASPGSLKQYPVNLEQLTLDTRFVGTVRRMRTLYGDPVNAGQPFALIRNAAGGVVGVVSTSEGVPLAVAGWSDGVHSLPAASHYSGWPFLAKVAP